MTGFSLNDCVWHWTHQVFSSVKNQFFVWIFFWSVGTAEGSGETGACGLKMGSPSASNKLPVSISHTGYFLEGLTFDAKLLSVKTSGLTVVPSICSKWEYNDCLMLNSEYASVLIICRKNWTASEKEGFWVWLVLAFRLRLFAAHQVAQAPHCALSVRINLYKRIIINDSEEYREYMEKIT